MLMGRYSSRLIFAAMVALAVLAFAIPLLVYRDVPQDVPARTILMLKTEAQHMTKLPIMFQQVTSATTIGTPPATSAEGVVVWRTLFGIRLGEVHIASGKTWREGDGLGGALFVWLVFLSAEVTLAWLLVRSYNWTLSELPD
ncbi:MAG: hypothetical protein U0232_05415 [Thermomicrobiales bacterium]